MHAHWNGKLLHYFWLRHSHNLIWLIFLGLSTLQDFNPWPRAFLHKISACPTDIENTLWQARDRMPNQHQINLLFVILPDIRVSDGMWVCFFRGIRCDFDFSFVGESHVILADKVQEVCNNMGVVYQCCLPKFARTQSKNYLLEAAHEIKSKVSFSSFVDVVFCCTKFSCLEFLCQVVERRTRPLRKAIPFVSEATTIFCSDISHCTLGVHIYCICMS
jgi:hypothetical protein